MKRRQLLSSLAAAAGVSGLGTLAAFAGTAMAAGAASPSGSALPPVEVFKNPSCGCCGAWVDHLKAAGFSVKVTEVADTAAVRRKQGLPDQFGSCHTGLVGGYVLEGHVPAREVKRLLAARPAALGLAVPGMPVGAPGMEVDDQKDAYQVLLVDKQGRSTVYASYAGNKPKAAAAPAR